MVIYIYILIKSFNKGIKMKNFWALLEDGYVHTGGLSKAEADEMLERYSRIYPDIEYCLVYGKHYQ